jgi:hypothetical protein
MSKKDTIYLIMAWAIVASVLFAAMVAPVILLCPGS